MNPDLVELLCDPLSHETLTLKNKTTNAAGQIISGELLSATGNCYPIIAGIPRFTRNFKEEKNAADAFGKQWNEFNFTQFKSHWLEHTIKNTFGDAHVFENKWVVDAGGGSGAQTLWMHESGAARVIMLEISDSVDDVVNRNLAGVDATYYDVIQCSIDQPPLKPGCIPGIVICHNVIQHTPSVEKTARALYALTAPGGEFVFNCYGEMYKGSFFKIIKPYKIYNALRAFLSKRSFFVRLWYCRIISILYLVPLLGLWLERLHFCCCGVLPPMKGFFKKLRHKYRTTFLVTYDWYGSHRYQHLLSNFEIQTIVSNLKPKKVLNEKDYYEKLDELPGIALRLFK